MKAAVYHGPNKLEVADVPEPNPREGTVKLRVGFNGICGTDLHEYYAGPIFIPTAPHPLTGQELPLVMGHEFAGVITEVGPGVSGWREGDRVAVEPIYKCGHCAPCQAGNYNICAQIGFHGLMSDGGMAEYTVVPTEMLHRLPDSVSLELGALVEPMSVAYHAATLGEVDAGDTAMVFGAGPIGIGLWFALRGRGSMTSSSSNRRQPGGRRSKRSAPGPWTPPVWTCPVSSPNTPADAAPTPCSTPREWRPRWRPRWPVWAPAGRW